MSFSKSTVESNLLHQPTTTVLVTSANDVSDQLRDSALQAAHFPELLALLPRIMVRTGIAVLVVLVLLSQDSAPAAPSVRLAVPVLFHPEIGSWCFIVSFAQAHILSEAFGNMYRDRQKGGAVC